MIILFSSYMVFESAVGWHLLGIRGNIGEFYTSKYIYRAIFSLVIQPLAFLFFSAFLDRFFFLVFVLFCFCFFVFSIVRSYCSFSICYMFYFHFWGTLFRKKRSLNVDKRDVGTVSSTHFSNVLFAEFEQLIVC